MPHKLTLHAKNRQPVATWFHGGTDLPSLVTWAGTNRFFTVNPSSMTERTPVAPVGSKQYEADYYEVDPPFTIGNL